MRDWCRVIERYEPAHDPYYERAMYWIPTSQYNSRHFQSTSPNASDQCHTLRGDPKIQLSAHQQFDSTFSRAGYRKYGYHKAPAFNSPYRLNTTSGRSTKNRTRNQR